MTGAEPLIQGEMPSDWEKLEGFERTLAQMFHIYFNPEVARRQAAGELPETFGIVIAQVLLPPDGPARVLFNDEVKGHGVMRAPRAVEKDEPVRFDDLRHLELYDLPDELLNNGHFTAFNTGDSGWRLFFNFQSGRAKAVEILRLSQQFHAAARGAVDAGHAGPAVENLFTAAELVSKAELILIRDKRAEGRTHGSISSGINMWGRVGNVDAAFLETFNRLTRQRPLARYGDDAHRPPLPSADDLDIVSAMIERGLQRVERRLHLEVETAAQDDARMTDAETPS